MAFITSTPTCMSPHRYVSSPSMDAHHAPPWVPPLQPCPLVLIASVPTHKSLHRYVSSAHMETCPLFIVAPAIHTSCIDAPHLTCMDSPLLSFSCTPAAHKPVLTTL